MKKANEVTSADGAGPLRFAFVALRRATAEFVSVEPMASEHQARRKSGWLRFALVPLKAYVIGVPIILLLWQTHFREGNPRGWDDRGERQLVRVLAEVFVSVQYGYLACVVGLVLTLIIGCRIRDVAAVRASLINGFVALFCLLLCYPLARPPATR